MNGIKAHHERRPVDDERLDSVIDAVAREMTEFEPSGALRAHVFERIEQRRRRPFPAIPRWAWAGSAALLVLAVATAVWITAPMQAPRETEGLVAEQRATRPPVQPAAPPKVAVDSHAPTAARPVAARPGTRLAARPAAAPRANAAADDVIPVPALAEIEPLTFSTVEPDPLRIAAVEVAPLTAMSEIDIPSLNPGANDPQSVEPKKEK
jgi:hypothetical protein